MSHSLRGIAKAITGASPNTPVKSNSSMRMARGTVQSLAYSTGRQIATVQIDGSATDIPADVMAGVAVTTGSTVEVLVVGTKLTVMGAIANDTGWQTLGLLNSWVNYPGAGFGQPQYRIVGPKVMLRGTIQNNTDCTQVICGLSPAPLTQRMLGGSGNVTGTGSTNVWQRCDAFVAGHLQLVGPTGAANYFSLDHIRYYTD